MRRATSCHFSTVGVIEARTPEGIRRAVAGIDFSRHALTECPGGTHKPGFMDATQRDRDMPRSLMAWQAACDNWSQRVGGFSIVPALVRQLGADPKSVLAAAHLQSRSLDDPDDRIPYVTMGRLL